ncbi:MAG: hypothetical protein AB1306_11735 [Nitrospirota bacterium]
MMRQKIVTTFMFLVIFLVIATVYVKDISSHPPPAPPSASSPMQIQPNVMPSPIPSSFTHYKWTPEDVVNTMLTNGIEIQKTGQVTEADYSSLPAKAKEAVRFASPSIGENAIGCILTFDRRDDMEKVINHYRELNNKAELYSWTFVKDNALIVLNGLVGEEKAKPYENALERLGER